MIDNWLPMAEYDYFTLLQIVQYYMDYKEISYYVILFHNWTNKSATFNFIILTLRFLISADIFCSVHTTQMSRYICTLHATAIIAYCSRQNYNNNTLKSCHLNIFKHLTTIFPVLLRKLVSPIKSIAEFWCTPVVSASLVNFSLQNNRVRTLIAI